ncbi:sensor histidine kinase [Bacillus manliponensis]|uniref:sensor histidine kinase n=1 Tax=Bacillus manliponensis TaxID=574376 RepID=UPI003518AC32
MNKKYIYIAGIILIYLFLVFYMGREVISNPYIGTKVEKKEDILVVTEIYENSWGSKHLEVNDQIIQVNPSYKEYTGGLEGAKNIKVVRNQKIIEYDVNYTNMLNQILYQLIIPVLFIGICLIYSVVLLKEQTDSVSHRNIIFLCFVISIGYFSASASARGNLLAREITGFCFNVIPFLLIHNLYYTFSFKWKKWYVPTFLFSTYILSFLICIIEVTQNSTAVNRFATNLRLGMFLLSILLLFLVVIKLYISLKRTEEGPKFRILLCGLLVSFIPILILYVIPEVILKKSIIPADVAVSSLIILPSTLFYLTKEDVYFDIDYLFKKIKQNSILALFPIILILVCSYYIGKQIDYLILFSLFLFLCFNIVFFLQTKLQDEFVKHFNYQESLYNFLKKTSKIYSLEGLVDCINEEIQQVLRGVTVISFEFDIEKKICCCSHDLNHKHVQVLHQKIEGDRKRIRGIKNIIKLDEQFYLVLGENKSRYTILYLTRKSSQVKFNPEEKKWIEMLMYYACIMFENLKKVDILLLEIKQLENSTSKYPHWVSKLFCTISEREYVKLANEIHDNILQDQLLLYREFEQIINAPRKDLNTLQKELGFFGETLLDNIYLIRETCNNLRPAFLEEIGIDEALKNLIQKTQLQANFEVIYSFEDIYEKVHLNHDQVTNIYRIVQELLNNALKHSLATQVNIILQMNEKECTLNYFDNGIGFNLKDAKKSHSMGLFSIKERVSAMEGDVKFISVPGEGLNVHITFMRMNTW